MQADEDNGVEGTSPGFFVRHNALVDGSRSGKRRGTKQKH
jgi:hypothetical protein